MLLTTNKAVSLIIFGLIAVSLSLASAEEYKRKCPDLSSCRNEGKVCASKCAATDIMCILECTKIEMVCQSDTLKEANAPTRCYDFIYRLQDEALLQSTSHST